MAGAIVTILLPSDAVPQAIRSVRRMRQADVNAAFRLVAEHADDLVEEWKRIHGK